MTHGKGANFVSLKSYFFVLSHTAFIGMWWCEIPVENSGDVYEGFDLHSYLQDLSGSRPLDEKTTLKVLLV